MWLNGESGHLWNDTSLFIFLLTTSPLRMGGRCHSQHLPNASPVTPGCFVLQPPLHRQPVFPTSRGRTSKEQAQPLTQLPSVSTSLWFLLCCVLFSSSLVVVWEHENIFLCIDIIILSMAPLTGLDWLSFRG